MLVEGGYRTTFQANGMSHGRARLWRHPSVRLGNGLQRAPAARVEKRKRPLGLIVQVCRVDLGCMMSSDVRFYVSGVLCYMVP